MSKITYGTIRKLRESEDLEVRVYDSEDAYKNDNYYVAEVLDKGTNIDEYCASVVDKFENPYYTEIVDSTGKIVGHTSGVDEEGNFLTEGVKKNPTEEYWDATEIARDVFVALLKFDFGYDYRGNNYIITIDNNEAERFQADSDEEAKEIYKKWKEAKDNGSVEYDFNNNYKKIVESKIEGIKDEDLEKYKKFVDKQLRDGAIDDPEYVKTLSKKEYEDLLVYTWMKDKDLIDMFREQHYKDNNLKEAVVEKHEVDWEDLAREISSTIELYEENKMEEDTDVFAGTEDAYAEEVLEQNLYDSLLYSGLFTIDSFEKELESPSYDGSKLDMLYRIMLDEIENGSAYNNGDCEAIIKAIKEFDSTYVEVKDDKAVQNESIKEGVETKAGNDFDEIASYMYNEANGDIDYIPSFEQTNDYIASVTKREYNNLYKAVKKAIENVVDHMYNGYIELSDRATIDKLYVDNAREVSPEEEMYIFENIRDEAFKKFEDETKTEIWQDGRSGRHIIVKDNYLNAVDYDYLCRVQKRLEDWVISEFARKMSNDNIEESVESISEAVNPNSGYVEYLKQTLGDTYKEEQNEKYLIVRGIKDGKPLGAVWYGKASKPQIYSLFRDEEQREEYIKRFLNNKASDEEAKLKRKEEQRLTKDHDIKVGDIFYTSWGYDQTNIDFYEVVNVRGSRIDLKELKQKYVSRGEGAYDDLVEPIPGEYANDKIVTISARADGSVTKISSFEYPSRWDGKPKYQTNPYSGH